jgi:hypothetical protein
LVKNNTKTLVCKEKSDLRNRKKKGGTRKAEGGKAK